MKKRGNLTTTRPFLVARTVLVTLACGLMLAQGAAAKPRLPQIISDHMVIQQSRSIHVWGWANPGERITVQLAGVQAYATTSANQRWSVSLPAMNAGGPYTLKVVGQGSILIKDVLIGEVWVASGQSNMTYALAGAAGGTEAVSSADDPEIRFFRVPKRIATIPQTDTLPASWKISSPETAKNFSAVAYFFARELQKQLGVPVGIIQSAWEGSPIEEWMPSQAFQTDDSMRAIREKWIASPAAVKRYVDRPAPFRLQFKNFELVRRASGDSNAIAVSFKNYIEPLAAQRNHIYWSYDWQAAPITTFEVGTDRSSNDYDLVATVSGLLDNTAMSLLTGKWNSDDSPADLSDYVGLRFWVRGTGSFRIRFNEPSITDFDDYASRFISVSDDDWKQVIIGFSDLHQEGWGVVHNFTPESLVGIAIESVTVLGYPNRPPSGLFNGMIHPLAQYPIRGAIWYQGESNALRAQIYRKELPALIRGWRNSWVEEDFPFVVVQLPNHGRLPEQPSESAWAELREAQFLTMKEVQNTGLAVTVDVGEPDNVHPPRKKEVGERLALWALGTTYQKPITYSGPIYTAQQIVGNQIILQFADPGGGLQSRDGGPLTGFAVAGVDRHFHWAEAVVNGNSVIVSSPQVPAPVAVRYAWGDSPICNLINKAGLPASPFRSDEWPGIAVESSKHVGQ